MKEHNELLEKCRELLTHARTGNDEFGRVAIISYAWFDRFKNFIEQQSNEREA